MKILQGVLRLNPAPTEKKYKDFNIYYPELDSLRAFAAFLVIIWHWFDHNHLLNRFSLNGEIGVTLFFVLSGFLITGILLKSKEKVSEKVYPIKNYFRIFYIRRTLRIFPVYYLLLFILLLINNQDLIKGFWWHFFYLSNFRFYIINSFEGSISVLWTLSVEEQFYLLWPVLILFLPNRFLNAVLIALIICAFIFRIIIVSPENYFGLFLMPAHLDSFCIGGYLAYAKLQEKSWLNRLNKYGHYIFFGCILLYLIFYHYEKIDLQYRILYFFNQLLIATASGLLIFSAINPEKNRILHFILNNRILIYLGRISYGLYLYHNFIPFFDTIQVPEILQRYSFWIIQGLRLVLLVSIATISWYFFEKPILGLKKKFEYSIN